MATIGYGQAIQKAAAAALAPSSLIFGTATADTLAIVISSDTSLVREVSIQSPLSNTSDVLVGDVTTRPLVLSPGGVLTIPTQELANVFIEAAEPVGVNFVATSEA
jgi:hypothetical protein